MQAVNKPRYSYLGHLPPSLIILKEARKGGYATDVDNRFAFFMEDMKNDSCFVREISYCIVVRRNKVWARCLSWGLAWKSSECYLGPQCDSYLSPPSR